MNRFGQYIRELRKNKKLTQRQLAAKVNMDFTYLSKIENGILDETGKPLIPSLGLIEALAKELEADVDELLILAEKTPTTVSKDWTQNKGFYVFFRTAKEHGLSEEDWKVLARKVKKQKTGKK